MPRSITGTQSRRRFLGVVALLASPAAALALMSGCSAGQLSQTDSMVPAVPGTNLDVKSGTVDVSLRNLMIAYNSSQGYPAGSTAPLVVYVVNNNLDQPVVLSGVTATEGKDGPSLGSVVLTGGPVDMQRNPAPGASASASAVPSSSASASAPPSTAPSGAASAKPSGGPSAPAGSLINLTIPPNSFVRLDQELGSHLAITGLTKPLTPGSEAYLTFSFAGAPPAGTPVPFEVPLSPPPRVVPSDAHEE